MKLWDKGIATDKKIEKFTVGNDRKWDMYLAPWDVLGTMAHVIMLQQINLLTHNELQQVIKELKAVYIQIRENTFQIHDDVEDIHSQVEFELTRSLGDTGKKIHSGRSRNDQVLLDIRLFTRHALSEIATQVDTLFDTLQKKSENFRHVLIPGYTHMQAAMPSSVGLWLGAYAESLADDLLFLGAAYKFVNQNPLGSAAGYGSSFPLNRELTTRLLGFETMNYNAVYAQMGRGKTEKVTAMALNTIAGTLSKLAYDVCMFTSQNFGFLSLPDALTTGSSIMPHKKNPDVFELIRARCNRIQSFVFEVHSLTGNLPSGYFRDYQLLKEGFFPVFEELSACIEMTALGIEEMIIHENTIKDPRYRFIFSVEDVNKQVMEGVPFRDAYRNIGESIANNNYKPDYNINHSHMGSIGNPGNDKIAEKYSDNRKAINYNPAEKAIEKLLNY